MTRQDANLQILDEIQVVLLAHPDIRFVQALVIMNLIPKDAIDDSFYFYEESETTLKNIIKPGVGRE
jgi:hypothetical protein